MKKLLWGVLALALGTADAQSVQDDWPALVDASYQPVFPVFPDTTIQPFEERIHAAIPLDPLNVALVSVAGREVRWGVAAQIRVLVMNGGRVSPDMRLADVDGGFDATILGPVKDGAFTIRVDRADRREVRLRLTFADGEGRQATKSVGLLVLRPPPLLAVVTNETVGHIGAGALEPMSSVPLSHLLSVELDGLLDSQQIMRYDEKNFPYKEFVFYRVEGRRLGAGPRPIKRVPAVRQYTFPAGLPGSGIKPGDIVRIDAVPKDELWMKAETVFVYSVR